MIDKARLPWYDIMQYECITRVRGDGMFDPRTNRYPYPEDTDRHYLEVKKNRGIVFDADYPYLDESRGFRFVDLLFRVAHKTVYFPVMRLRMGLRVEGKENLRRYREVLDGGFVSVCNHVHMWDYPGILSALSPRRGKILVWAPNINGENGTLIRHVGGIPIPEGSPSATRAYIRTVRKLLCDGGWLHLYPEGSMWEYYAPIRPFKTGAAYFAVECDKPILPLAYTYREPGRIRGRLFRQIAVFTLHIGEPIYRDPSLPKKEQQADLTRRAHAAVCALAGFGEGENLYPPIRHNAKRVDYYTDTYGVGYKGSR